MDQLLNSVSDMIEGVVYNKLKDYDIQYPSLKHLLLSNECPSERETLEAILLNRQLSLRIEKHKEAIHLLRDGIRDVVNLFHAAIAKLDTDKQRAIDDGKAYTRILAPVRRIPTEILQVIFRFVVGKSFDALSVVRGPWVLGKVCRRWRNVVLSTPELWSSFRLDTMGPQRLVNSPYIARGVFECILALSRPLPLRVFADTKSATSSAGSVTTNALLSVLSESRHLQRLQEFNLPAQNAKHLSIHFGNLPELEALRMILNQGEYYEWPAFRDLPKLKKLVLHGPGSGALLNNLPYNQLSELTLMQRGNLDEIIDLLRSCPDLQVLQVLDTQGNPPVSEFIMFPCLHRLVSEVTLIQHLTLPVIRELELVGVDQSGYDDVLRDLFDRSEKCVHLVKFRITSDATIMGLNNVLRTMPSLVELTAEAISFQTIFMDTFLALLSISSFLPVVEKISIAISDLNPPRVFNHGLMSVLETRFKKGYLKSFHLNVPTPDAHINHIDIIRMRTLRAQGLDLNISYVNRELLAG